MSFKTEDNYVQFRLTFTDNGGTGTAIDAFTATCSRKITYIYQGKNLAVDASSDAASCYYDFSNLKENSTYYCSMQSSDITKGCEEHISPISAPIEVTTLPINSKDEDSNQLPLAIDSINYNALTHVVYLSKPETGNMLYIYNAAGNLVYYCPTYTGVVEYIIPVEQLQKDCLYLIKYVENGKVRRKQSWAKFML